MSFDEETENLKFLNTAIKQVKKFLAESQLQMQDMPYVLRAYGSIMDQSKEASKISHELEAYVLERAKKMTADMAANFAIFSVEYARDDKWVLLVEKVIAQNIDSLQNQEGGTAYLLEIMQGLQLSKHSTSKIFELLITRISKQIDQLSIDEQG